VSKRLEQGAFNLFSRKRKDGWNQELFPRLRVLLPGWPGELKEQRAALTAVSCWPGLAARRAPKPRRYSWKVVMSVASCHSIYQQH
jgi:hypothetical protein